MQHKTEPVKIRYKNLKDERQSIYLDFVQDGKRTYEFLKLYLIPETGNKEAKEQNAKTMKDALRIKSQKTIDILNNVEGNTPAKNEISLISWIEHYRDEKEGVTKRISTYNNVIKLLKAFSGDDFLLKNVNEKYCMDLYRYLLTTPTKKTGKPLSKSSIEVYCTCLSTILKKAVKNGFIQSNPYDILERSEKVRGVKSTKKVYLKREEIEKLEITSCRSEEVKKAFLFATFSGLRLSDIEQLQWKNIEWQADGKYKIDIVMQKTQTPLDLPLAKIAIKWLPERAHVEDDRVFSLPSRQTINSTLKEWASAAGIAPAKASRIHFHVSRHSFTMLLVSLKIPIQTISKLLGQKNIGITLAYIQILSSDTEDATNKLNDSYQRHRLKFLIQNWFNRIIKPSKKDRERLGNRHNKLLNKGSFAYSFKTILARAIFM